MSTGDRPPASPPGPQPRIRPLEFVISPPTPPAPAAPAPAPATEPPLPAAVAPPKPAPPETALPVAAPSQAATRVITPPVVPAPPTPAAMPAPAPGPAQAPTPAPTFAQPPREKRPSDVAAILPAALRWGPAGADTTPPPARRDPTLPAAPGNIEPAAPQPPPVFVAPPPQAPPVAAAPPPVFIAPPPQAPPPPVFVAPPPLAPPAPPLAPPPPPRAAPPAPSHRVVTATPEGLVRAINVLANGGLAVIPTETVYGLAADATNAEAVARIFAAKGRPRINPLIIHLADAADAAQHAQLGPKAQALAEAFWPGPLTLVVLRRPDSPVAELACAGLDTIALRTPALPVAREIIRRLGRPLAAPSANLSGRLSTTTADDAAEDLSAAADLILDAGASPHGLESTIVGLPSHGPPRLLRPGAVPRESIEAIIGPLETPASGQGLQAPGMMASHYAPLARLRLNAALPAPGEAFLAFGPNAPDTPLLPNANLSPSGNLVEAAAQLYRLLRKLDAAGPAVIAVAPIPNIGLGEAINDRLARASAPRPGQF